MITSLMETLELQNFGHITISVIKFELRDKNFVGDVIYRNCNVIDFISKYIYFNKA